MGNGSQTLDYSLLIAIVAIVISFIHIIIDRRGYRSQIRNEFFSTHFKNALNEDLPKLRKELHFENEKLTGFEQFQEKLASIRNGADFFRYANPVFYWWFKRRNQCVEDYLAEPMNKRYDDARQRRFFRFLDFKMFLLYHSITKKYFG